MKKREYIIFEVDSIFKKKIIKIAENHKANGVNCPLKLSAFCRMAIENFIEELESKK
jgi:hypothetical protein